MASLTGSIGPDILTGTSGHDIFTGLESTDTAVIDAASTSAIFRFNAAGQWVVTTPDTGTDTFNGIELVQFTDATLSLGAATPQPDLRANTMLNGHQITPQLFAQPDGAFVLTWLCVARGGWYSREFASTGWPSNGESPADNLLAHQIARFADGRYVQVRDAESLGTGFDVYVQIHHADGSTAGSEFRANSFTTHDQADASVAVLGSGDFVVVWSSQEQASTPGHDVYSQRFDSAGNAKGGEVRVNTQITDSQWDAQVTALADGGYLVVWSNTHNGDSDPGIYLQRYDANGSAVAQESQVSELSGAEQFAPGVAGLAGGGFVVVWSDNQNVLTRTYDSNANALGSVVEVNLSENIARSPVIEATSDGGFVIAWEAWVLDASTAWTRDIYYQHFDSSGHRRGSGTLSGDGNDNLLRTAANMQSTLLGGDGNDTLYGAAVDSRLYGDAGDDLLVGGGGGSDIFYGGEGNDTIRSFGLSGGDTWGDWLYGEGGNDSLSGDDGRDLLWGGDGNDWLGGAGDNDSLEGEAGHDVLIGGDGNDTLVGDENLSDTGHDSLLGGSGDDTLIGYAGVNTLDGGEGSDYYQCRSSLDVIVDSGASGTDTLALYADLVLAASAGIENIDFAHPDHSAAVSFSGSATSETVNGNSAANTIAGMGGRDSLYGMDGNDSLHGGDGADVLAGGNGNDTLNGYWCNDGLWAGAGDDSLLGGGGNDRMGGDAGNDVLNGDAGNDSGWGGEGNDTLNGGEGSDSLSGGIDDDLLRGGKGGDLLKGEAGSDTLAGGWGVDTLTGGSGADRFLFDGDFAQGVDLLTDFNGGEDILAISRYLTDLPTTGMLAVAQFHAGASAADADDRFVHDSTTGHLYYDADGSNAGAQVHIALLGAGTALDAGDILIV